MSESHFTKMTNQFTIKSITKRNLSFFISWIIVFVWLYSYFLPFGGFKFESNLYNLKVGNEIIFTAVWLITTPTITFFVNGRKYVSYTFLSVIMAILSFFILRFTPGGIISEIILCLGSACMGHIFASSCYSFFMVLNNAEKFYSMLLAVFIPKLFMLLKPILNKPDIKIDVSNIIIMILLFILLISSFLYRHTIDSIPKKADAQPPKKAYILMLLVFAVLALNDVIAPAIISATLIKLRIPFEPLYFSGILLGIVFILVFQKILKTELYNILNLSFAFAALGFVSSSLSLINEFYGILSFLFFGVSYVLGFVNIYYLAGFMAKKFQSLIFYRVGIALSSVFYFAAIFATHFLDDLKNAYFNDTIALSAFMSVIVLIAFLFSTPFFIKNLSSKEWMDDTYRIDITHGTRLSAKLKDYSLSPREIETCQELLAGYTLRQISAIMGISFSTVNTYCNSIYKKLGINSRTELVVMLKEYDLK